MFAAGTQTQAPVDVQEWIASVLWGWGKGGQMHSSIIDVLWVDKA